jgi:hypothetical protein
MCSHPSYHTPSSCVLQQAQSEAGQQAVRDVAEARSAIAELFGKVRDIKAKVRSVLPVLLLSGSTDYVQKSCTNG